MQFPSGFLVQQSSVAESEGAKSKCLAGDLVETGVCQFVIEAPSMNRHETEADAFAVRRIAVFVPIRLLRGFRAGLNTGSRI